MMKKMKIISLCLMIMGLILGCENNRSNNDFGNRGNGGGGANETPETPENPIIPIRETLLIAEISNPPVLDEAEQENIYMILDNKTIITHKPNENKYYLLAYNDISWDRVDSLENVNYYERLNENAFIASANDASGSRFYLYFYDGYRWIREEMPAASGLSKVNSSAFIVYYYNQTTGNDSATLRVYDKNSGKWENHSELNGKKIIENFSQDTILAEESTNRELWAFQNGRWELVIDGFVSYTEINASSYFFIDSDYIHSLWHYKDGRWNGIFDYELYSALILSENYLLIEYALWAYKNGDWSIYAPAAGKKFVLKGSYLHEFTEKEHWVSKNNEWAPLPGLKKFFDSQQALYFVRYINDNTVLIKDRIQGSSLFYDASFMERQDINGYSLAKEPVFINESSMILFSQAEQKYVLLEYDNDMKEWKEGSFRCSKLPKRLNENSFFSNETKELWGYEAGEWKVLLANASYYNPYLNSPRLHVTSKTPPNNQLYYAYDGHKWNKICEANLVKPLSDSFVTAHDGGALKVWYFDGKDWAVYRSFEDVIQHERYHIKVSDGKLYYFTYYANLHY